MSADRELIGLLIELSKDAHEIECYAKQLKTWCNEPTTEGDRRHRAEALIDHGIAVSALEDKIEDLPNVFENWTAYVSPSDV